MEAFAASLKRHTVDTVQEAASKLETSFLGEVHKLVGGVDTDSKRRDEELSQRIGHTDHLLSDTRSEMARLAQRMDRQEERLHVLRGTR